MDAAGGFGLFAGLLSVLLPFFLGLAVVLAALAFGTGAVRLAGPPTRRAPSTVDRRNGLLALLVAGTGWIGFLIFSTDLERLRGLFLGLTLVPLWWTARRPSAFGGG